MVIYGRQVRKSDMYEMVWKERFDIRLIRGNRTHIRCPFCGKKFLLGNSFGVHVGSHSRKGDYLAVTMEAVHDQLRFYHPGVKFDEWSEVQDTVLKKFDELYEEPVLEDVPWREVG